MGDYPSQLGRYRNQKSFFILRESAVVTLLYHQHAEQIALVNNGRAQKGVKSLFSQPVDQLKLWVRAGVFEVQWLLSRRNPTNQTLIKPQPKLAYFVRIEAFRRAENQLLTLFVVQINGAHVGLHRRSHLSDNQRQRIL